jgi:enoyl-CoA hydratase
VTEPDTPASNSHADSPAIIVSRSDEHAGVVLVTINNPPVNAITTDMYLELTSIFREIGQGDDTCVVLNAVGERAFCAGSDTREHVQISPATAPARSRMVRECFQAMRECRIPIVAAVGGPTAGAGIALLGSVDVIVASTRARFGIPEINVGVMGGARHLGMLVPEMTLRWLALSGEFLSADDMHRLGGVVRVTDPEDLLETAMSMAATIASKGGHAVRLMKEVLNLSEPGNLINAYHIEQLGTAIMSGVAREP